MFVMEAAVKELKIDKDNLVRENAKLREKNLNFALITSDLNSKVKELEHERDSLVTAMKLQQQEFEQGHYEREDGEKWKTVSAIKQSKEDQASMNFESNRYDVLNDEANTQNSDLHASVIEINSETQQPSTGQNTAVNSDNISPENGDNVSNCTELTHDTIQGNKGNSSRATKETPVKERVPTQGIVIIGDSIIKNVNPVKLSKRRVQGRKMAAESGNQSTDTCNSERDVNPPKEYFHFSDITIDNVFIRLQKLNASKATGMDGIPAKILKMIANFIAPSLTFIFNLSIRTGTYIDEWKLARVIPIYKSEDKRKCENYRPISVLPIVSKIFEGEVFSQIYSFLNRHAPLSKFQSGFRPKHGTLAALIQMCDQWQTDMDDGKINGVVFLDICKAFDSVNHQILLEKLETQFGIHDTELKWFQSYLKDRKQVCFVNEQTSSAGKIICGIPQGSILGPLLFLLYINDMPDILEKTTPCLYADDTQIYSSSHDYDTLVENLNMDLANIQKWLAKNKLKSHAKKTKVMFIGSLHNLNNKVGNRTVEMNKIPVPQTSTFKCLGVDLDQKLNWEKHIDSVCHKISAGIGAMKRIKPYVPTQNFTRCLQNIDTTSF